MKTFLDNEKLIDKKFSDFIINPDKKLSKVISIKKIISEKGIDIDSLIGSGRDGRITKDDAVKAAVAMGSSTAAGEDDETARPVDVAHTDSDRVKGCTE